MKILNNFDTELKKHEYDDAVKTFWKDNVLLIQRYVAYWIIKGIIPIAIYVIVSIIILYLLFTYIFEQLDTLFWFCFWVWCLGSLIFLYNMLMKYIDYTMDFTIITPNEILTHKQYWIINSDYKNFPAKNIRSISSGREGFLWNVFWYGHILFLTDWSVVDKTDSWRHWPWKILLTYVYRPNETRKKIMNLCIWDENMHYFKIDEENNKK